MAKDFWKCNICQKGQRTFVVKVLSNGKLIHTGTSIIKAENYAIKYAVMPCIIKHYYHCERCGNESNIVERVYRGF